MGNTLENKAKFFAQYWGQEVYPAVGALEVLDFKYIDPMYDTSVIELKPLSSITDEDAFEVARFVSPMLFEGNGENGDHFIDKSESLWYSIKHKKKVMMVDIDLDGYVFEYRDDEEGYTRPSNSLAGADYLRSKGYALPWMGLSVEDLVNFGWIKLKNTDL